VSRMKLKRGKDPLALLACGAVRVGATELRPWLNSIRKGRGLTIEQCAKLAGMGKSAAAMLFTDCRPGRVTPNTASMARMFSVLGVAVVLCPVDAFGRTDPRVLARPEAASNG
jgi:transcriptional regulator with XRE-family HTH domain